jgi:hypothetical protein
MTREQAQTLSYLKLDDVVKALRRKPAVSQQEFDDALASHRFQPVAPKNTYDEVQVYAMKLVSPLVDAALRKKGIEPNDLPRADYESFLLRGLEKRPDLYDEAQSRIAALS